MCCDSPPIHTKLKQNISLGNESKVKESKRGIFVGQSIADFVSEDTELILSIYLIHGKIKSKIS